MKSYGLAAVLLVLACNGSLPDAPASSSPDGGPARGPTEAGVGAVDGATSGSDPTEAGVGAVDGATMSQDDSAPPLSPDAGSCAQYLGSSPASAWVYAGANGKLRYKPLDANGDTIMDFSSAGYMGGGVALPTVSVEETLTPSGGDDTSAIQAAIDAVSALPLQAGIRGAVLLKAGTYMLAGTLRISASGVVLRGSGAGASGTVLMAQSSADFVLRIAGSGSAALGSAATITDAYVPSGASTFHVSDGSAFAVGDAVFVQRPVTSAWVTFMGMNGLTTSDGGPQTWIAPGTVHQWDRVVTAITGNQITVDAPIGMATVFVGRLMGSGGFSRTVAIKRLHPRRSETVAARATSRRPVSVTI